MKRMPGKLSTFMTALAAALPLAIATGCTTMEWGIGRQSVTHVTLNYTEYGTINHKTFALTPEIMKEAERWRSEIRDRSAVDFSNWLHRNGAKLDREDGPAWTRLHIESGSKVESWYRNGDYFRPGDKPEIVETKADGSTREMWVRKGDFTQTVETDPDNNVRWERREGREIDAGNGAAILSIPGVVVLPPAIR